MHPASARPGHRRWLKALLASTSLSAAGSLLVAVPPALANPQGGQVVGGSGSIVQSPSTPNRLIINQTTQNLALDWQSFSIAAGEQVIFRQPNAAAIALNRVTGGDPSTIAGQLTANGQVWLVNPNGVFFTRGAVVNVAGIVATTSGIEPASFMAGTYVFDQPGSASASIVNAGKVTVADAGLAAFVAPTVANSGVIAARLGKVALVSGSKFTVDLYGDNLVKIAVDDQTGSALAGAAVSNSGKIAANGGTVLLSVSAAESIVNNAINVSGTIEARTAGMKGGKIVLSGGSGQVAVSGTLDASGKGAGETGGTVEVLGGAVALGPMAKVDVSGDAGGGTALIGGNFHGAGPEPNAATTSLAAGAIITADAITSGNGGQVALWSDDATDDAGSITARGGARSGDGGFVETSSGDRLTIADGAIVNTGAAHGEGGEWLLDPTEIDITTVDNNDTTQSPFTAVSLTTSSTVSNGTIDAALGTGDVVIQTAAGDIAVDADIVPDNTAGGNHSLGLASAGSILLNANIDFAMATGGASTGSIYLFAPTGSITQSAGTITLAGGQLSMQAATGIGNGGALSVAGADAATIVGIAAATSSGGIAITGGTGIIEVTSVPGATLSSLSFGPTTGMAAGGTLALSGGSIVAAAPLSATAISLTGTSGITFDDAAGTLATSSGGGQVYTGAVTLAADATLRDTLAGPISFVNTIDATAAGAQALTITASNSIALGGTVGGMTPLGAITLANTELDLAANIAITTSGGAVSQTGATVLLGGASGSSVTIDTTANMSAAGANIGFSGAIDGTAAGHESLSFAAGSGTIALAGNLGAGTALGALTLTDTELDLGANNGIVTSGGAVSQTGATVLLGGMSGSTVTIDTTANTAAGANIGFSGTIDGTAAGHENLSLAAGSGTIVLAGNLGAGTALGALSLTDAALDLGAGVSIVTSGGAVSQTGAIVLLGGASGSSVTIDTTANTSVAGANIGFSGTLDGTAAGHESLSLAAGSGTIALSGNLGTGTALGALTLADAALDLGAGVGIVTSGGAVSQTGVTVLLGGASGSSVTIDTTANTSVAGANIGFVGAIDGTAAGHESLSLAAGSGTIALSGNLGAGTALGALSLTDAALDLGAGVSIVTSGGAVSQTGVTVLLGGMTGSTVTIDTTANTAPGANIGFSGAIDGTAAGHESLSLAAGSGTIALLGNLGAGTALGALSLTDAALDLGAGVSIVTSGGAVSQTGATVLLGGASGSSVTIDTTANTSVAGANIGFSGAIDGTAAGHESLSLAAGSGTIALAGNLGAGTALGALSLTDAALDLGAGVSIVTSGGAVSQAGATVLLGGASPSIAVIDTTANSASSGADIGFSSTIDGSDAGRQGLALKAGASGTIALAGAVGSGTALGAVTLASGGTIAIAHSLTTSGGAIAATSASDITVTAPIASGSGGAITLAAAGGLTISASVGSSQAGPVSLSAAKIALTAPIDGAATLTIGPSTGSANLGLGGGSNATSDEFNLSQAELDEIGANFTGVSIVTGSGTVHVDNGGTALAFADPITLAGGAIALLDGGGLSTGGKPLTLAAPVTLGNSATLDTTASGHTAGANVTLAGAVTGSSAGAQTLTIDAGTAGTIALDGAVGAPTPLGSVTLSDAVLDLAANVGITTTNGAVSETGQTVLQGNASPSATTIATSGGAIFFSGSIDGDAAGKRSLTLAAGTGTISLQANVGASQPLDTLALGDAQLDLAGTLGIATAGGGVSQSGITLLSGGASPSSITVATSGGTIAFAKTIDDDVSGKRSLVLEAGTGTISLAMNVGATTPLGAMTLSDAALELAANAGIKTSDGAVSETGATILGGAGATTATIATSGGAIAFGAIDGSLSGDQALLLNAGAGTVTLSGAIGAHTPLGALTLSDEQLVLMGSLSAAAVSFSQSGATLLQGGSASAVTIATSGGAIGFAGTIDADSAGLRALTLAAGTGTIALQGGIGGATALGAVSLSDAALDLSANVGIRTSDGAVSQSGATVLGGVGATTATIATSGGAITFGAIDGTLADDQALLLNAGAGTVTLSGAIGAHRPLGALTLSDGQLVLIGSLSAAATSFSQSGATLLQGGSASAVTIATSGGAIGFASTIDADSAGLRALTLAAGTGTIALQGSIGGATALGAVSLSDAALDLAANVGIRTSDGAVSQSGATVLGGAGATASTIATSGGNIAFDAIDGTTSGRQALGLDAGSGTISLATSIGAMTPLGAVTLNDAQLELAANVGITTRNGAISQTGAALIEGGAAATLTTIDTTDAGSVDGANISWGASDGTAAGHPALSFAAGSGTITLQGNLGGHTALGAVTLGGATTDLAGNAGIATADSAVTVSGALALLGAASSASTIATSGGAITLNRIDGGTAGDQALTLDAGATGTILLQASVGATTALGALTFNDALLELGAGVSAATSGGAIAQSGTTLLLAGTGASASLIDTAVGHAAGADIDFAEALDAGAAGSESLTINAGTGGTISLSGPIGGMTALGAVTLTDAVLDIAANVSVTISGGDFSQTGATLFLGGVPTVSAIATGGGNVSFAGAVDGGARGDQALTFDAGTGTVTLSGNVGKTTALGALSFTDAALDLGTNVSVVTSNGAVIDTGALVLLGGASAGTAAIDTTAGGFSSGANITLAQQVDATGSGQQGLSLSSGTGTIALQANVGGMTPLGAVALHDAALDLAANVGIATSNGAVSEIGTTILGGGGATVATIATSGGSIAFGTIDGSASGAQALRLDAGTGTITLNGSLGGMTPLGAITLDDAALDIAANVGVTTAGDNFSQTGSTLFLGAAATMSTIATGGGNISFAGTVDGGSSGNQALNLIAGAGAVTLSGNAGKTTALGALSFDDAELDLGVGVSVVTSNGAIIDTGALVLLGGASAGTAAISAGTTLTLAQTVDATGSGKQSLKLSANTIALQGNIGGTTPLGAVILDEVELDLGANVDITTSGGGVQTLGHIILGGGGATANTISTSGGGIFLGLIDGTIPGAQALRLDAGTGDVSLTYSLGGSTPLGAITLVDGSLGIAGGLSITTSGGAFSQTGATVLGPLAATSIATGGGAITFAGTIDGDSQRGAQSLTLDAGNGTIMLLGNVGGTTALGALSFTDAQLDLGNNVSIITSGGAVLDTGALVLLGNANVGGASIDTTAFTRSPGADITVDGAIDGTISGKQGLALSSGVGTITFQGNVGATTPLATVDLTDAVLLLPANFSATMAAGAFAQMGATVLGGGAGPSTTTIDISAGVASESIVFSGTIDGTVTGGEALSLVAGSGQRIDIAGTIGGSTPLGAISMFGATVISANVAITTDDGPVSVLGPALLLGSPAPGNQLTGVSSASITTGGANITFSGSIDGFAAGNQALALNAGAGTIMLMGSLGASTPLGAVSLTGAALDLAANVGIVTAGGAVTSSGPILLAGAGATTTVIDTAGADASGANITLAGPIDGSIAGDQALTLNAGTGGTISLAASLGAAMPLGAVTLSDALLDLAPNVGIVTSGGAVSETGNIVLRAGGNPTLSVIDTTAEETAAGAGITVAGTIDGGAAGQQALTLDASGATIALSGNVGRATALGALGLSDALLQIGPNTSVATAGGAIMQSGAVVLLAGAGATATTIDTTGGGFVSGGADMSFGGTIDGGAAGLQGLTLTAGTAGTITLQQNLGAATPLGALTMRDALLQLPADFAATTAGGAVSLTGAVLLAGATVIDTTNAGNSEAGANIILSGPVDGSIAGAQALTLNAGSAGTIALSGNLGGSTALGAVSLSDAVLDLGANITTAGGAVSQTGGTVVTSAAIDTTEGGATAGGANITMAGSIDGTRILGLLTLDAGSGTVALSGNVGQTTPLGWLTLVDGELDLAPNVGIATVLNFSQTGATILLGGVAATLNSITGGSCSGAPGLACFVGTITFNGPVDGSASGKQAVTLSSDGTIGLQGGVGAQTPLGALTLNSAQLELAPNVAVVTAGGAVSQVGATVLLGNGAAPTATTIDTTAGGTVTAGANITFAGDIDGSTPGLQALLLDAGASGTISLGAVGSTTALGALSLSDAILRLGANATIATAGGAFTQLGTTLIATGTGATVAVIDSTAGGFVPTGANIVLSGTIDGASAGENALTLDAGTGGTISLLGAVGSGTPLGAVTLNDAALDLGGGASITTAAGAFVESGATLLLGGGGPSIAVIDTIARGKPQGASITFTGPIDGAAAGMQALTLDSGTQGTISLLGSVGGATALGALSFTDAVLALGANVTVTTAGGAVSETGATILLAGATPSASAIDTTNRGAAPLGADLSFTGAIDATAAGAQSLALDAGTAGAIALAANIGAHTALGGFSLSDGLLQLPASFAITSAGGAVSETGTTIIAGGTAPSSLVIDTTAGGMAVGADITLGTLNGGAAGRLALVLNAGSGGTIALMGGVGSEAALATLSLSDAALALGPGASVTTAGTPFVETGATILLGDGGAATSSVIDTTNNGAALAGAAIDFAGPIDGGVAGKQSLTLAAGAATISLGGSIGSATALGALTFDDSILALGPNIGISTAGGAVLQSGVTRLLAGAPVAMGPSSRVTIETAGGAISFGDTIDASTLGGAALALNAGSGGTVTLAANVGATTPLGGLALGGGTIDLDAALYETNAGAITATGVANFLQPQVTIATVMQVTGSTTLAATTGAAISLAAVNGPTTTLTVDPGTAFASIGGGTLVEIAVLEGRGSTLNGLVVGKTSLGGTGTGNGLTVDGFGGADAALHAFIRPGGDWLIDGGAVLITDPALAGLSNAVLNNEGIGPAIALMVQIQQLIARGDTGETAAQQAFDQYPNRSNYAADPFHQRYNILGVAQQEGVGGFEDISYIQDGFWEGLLKAK